MPRWRMIEGCLLVLRLIGPGHTSDFPEGSNREFEKSKKGVPTPSGLLAGRAAFGMMRRGVTRQLFFAAFRADARLVAGLSKGRLVSKATTAAWLIIPLLVAEQMLAEFLERAFTQEIGIALAGLGKFDPVAVIVREPKGYGIISSATFRTRLVSGSTAKSSR